MRGRGGRRGPAFVLSALWLAGLWLLAAPAATAAGKPAGESGDAEPPYAPGEVLVRFRPRVTSASAAVLADRMGVDELHEFGVLSGLRGRPLVLLRSSSFSTTELLAVLRDHPDVEAFSPNYRRRAQRLPDDPGYASLWGMSKIAAPSAWDTMVGSSGVVLALIDTGVDAGHPDLKANLWRNAGETPGNGIDDDGNGFVDDVHGFDFAADASGNNDSDPMDIGVHGTHVAGTMAAVGDNGAGVCGVNWVARVMVLKGFRPDMHIYDSDCIEAIEYAVMMKRDYGVNLVAINASFGGADENRLQRDAIAAAGEQGIAFVCAAGNDGEDSDTSPFYPASYDLANIIAVAASDEEDRLASFSNYGAGAVDIAAPGVNILSTAPEGRGRQAWLRSGGDSFDGIPLEFSGLTSAPGLEGEIIDCGRGQDAADFPAAVSGHIALIERGDITFEEKAENAQDAGAVGVVIFNNAAANFSGTLGRAGAWVPVIALSRADGLLLKARSGQPVNLTCRPADYTWLEGTSMACPHVCGALGLLAAQFPGEDLARLVGRLYSGAERVAALENRVRTGGRLNLARALAQSLAVAMTVSRRQASAWVITRDYAEVIFRVEKDAGFLISGETYAILRKSGGGAYQAVATVAAGELRDNAFTYLDKYLEHGMGYTYVIEVESPGGKFLARSNEQGI